MKKLVLLTLLGIMTAGTAMTAFAQDMDAYRHDRRYCASGRSGMDFDSCMRRLRHDRERDRDRYERREERRGDYERGERWGEPPPQVYVQPAPPVYVQPAPVYVQPQREPPKLSDMQQRALDNCAMLAYRDQPRCRATVMSTVR